MSKKVWDIRPKQTFWDSRVHLVFSCNGCKTFSSPSISKKAPLLFLSWQRLMVFNDCKSWLLTIKSDRFSLSYHCNFSMVFIATITIEWNGWGQSSCSMVFRWLLGPPTIVFDVLFMVVHHRSTGRQTMRWKIPSLQSNIHYPPPAIAFDGEFRN